MSIENRTINPVHCLGAGTFALFLLLSLNSHFHIVSDLYLWLFTALFVSNISIYLYLQTRNHNIKYIAYPILLWAISYRILGLTSAPLLEDDFYRFLWDGYMFLQLGTPYNSPPSMFFDTSFVSHEWNTILNGISYPDLPTVYGPTLQYIFLICSYLAPTSELFLRCILTGFELTLLLVLFKLYKNSSAFILYAWCPLLIKEVSFSAHPDIIGITFLFSGILLTQFRQYFVSGLMLALAIACKPFAIILAPFFIIKGKIIALLSTLLGLSVLYIPFILKGSTEYNALYSISREWEFNSSIYAVVSNLITHQHAQLIVFFLFTMIFLYYWYRYFTEKNTNIPRGDILFLSLFLLSPVFNPWYVIWILPFLIIYPSVWGWSVPIAVSFSYIIGLNLNTIEIAAYEHPQWVRIFEFGIIIIAYFVLPKIIQSKRETC